jgi:ABC-type molybdate transport system substrate-binding protein
VQAAVTTTTKDRARAARFVEFLASEKGQQAFASCR